MAERSKDEIAKEVERLREIRKHAPETTLFGDNNHEKLDAVIEALEKRMTERQAETRFYVDETAEEYCDGDNDLYHDVCRAIRWMNGKDEAAYSAEWQ